MTVQPEEITQESVVTVETDTSQPEPQPESPKPPKRKRVKRLYLSERRVIGWSFMIPLLILGLVYAIHQFFPFGDRSPLTIDLYHQYAPFLVELRDKMLGGEGLFYSWDGGLGNNFYALFAYYLSSPLNFLLLIFPPSWITEAVTVLTLLKVGATGGTFAYMLQEAFTPWGQRTISSARPALTHKVSQTATDWSVVICSSFFALSGYLLTYSWDIMWLDAIAVMPLIILGLHRLVREGRFLLYTLSLAAALVFNYYIALFICIFTAFYFPVCYFSSTPYLRDARERPAVHFFKRAGAFAGSSILAAAISAFLTLPTYLSLQLTSASTDQFPQTFDLRFSLFEFTGRHMINMPPSIRDGLPNIYTGVLTFALIPLYVFAKHIRLREKVLHLVFLFFLFFSFNSNILDFLWHGMHYPNQLPYRYSFVYSFLVLIMGFRVLSSLRSFSARTIALAFGGGILYAFMAEVVIPDQVDHESTYTTIAFLLIYMSVIVLQKTRKTALRTSALTLVIVCLAELVINTGITIFTIDSNEHYTTRSLFNDDIPGIRELVKEQEKDDPGFWRMEVVQQKTTNSPALYGYRGFTIFSSTSYEHTAAMMRSLGYHGNNINSYKYESSTAFLDAIFGIKYILNKETTMQSPRLNLMRQEDAGYLYRNEDALSLGFMVPETITDWTPGDRDPFRNQEGFLRQAGLDPNLYEELELIPDSEMATNAKPLTGSKDIGYTMSRAKSDGAMEFEILVEPTTTGHYTLYFDPDGKSSVEVIVNERTVANGNQVNDYRKLTSINEQEMVELGYRSPGDLVRVIVKVPSDGAKHVRFWGASTNESVYRQAIEELGESQLKITEFSDSHVKGSINAREKGVLFLSIPFDPSWQVLIDGEPGDVFAVGGGLLGTKVGAGQHEIELTFRPPAFTAGLVISLVGVLILTLLTVRDRRRRKIREYVNPVLYSQLNADEQDGYLYGTWKPSRVAVVQEADNPAEDTEESATDCVEVEVSESDK